jgi:ribonuclease BN (tRNA processing enzyme)
MELTVLGAGPAYTDRPGSTGASYLVRAAGESLLLDLGQGSFPALASRLDPSTLAGVLVSHLHPDHFIDLVPLRHYLHYEFSPPRRVRVLGPAGLADRIDALHAEPGFTAAVLDVEALSPGTRRIGPFSVEAGLVTHTAESYAFRVTAPRDGPGLVYSGDCGRASDLLPLVRPGDTLLIEISFGAGPVPPGAQHLDGPAVGGLAAEARAGRVLLTHIQMGFDPDAAIAAVRARFEGPVDLVTPGLQSEV